MGVLEWESQCGAAMGWGRLQPQQALPGVEGAPQRLEALTPAFQAVGFLQEGPGNQPQPGHWLVRLGTQASGIVSFLLRCPWDPDKGSAFRKSSPLPTTAEETAYYQLGPEKARERPSSPHGDTSVHLGWVRKPGMDGREPQASS